MLVIGLTPGDRMRDVGAADGVGARHVRGGLYGIRREIAGNNIGIGGAIQLALYGFDINAYATTERWDTSFPLGFRPFRIDNVTLNADLQDTLAANNIDPSDFVLPTSCYDQEETLLAALRGNVFAISRAPTCSTSVGVSGVPSYPR